jgi:hypothetical protein
MTKRIDLRIYELTDLEIESGLIVFAGMMSLINTNQNYLKTMGISEESAIVGVIVSVYYCKYIIHRDLSIGHLAVANFTS